jgi:predicted amidohydrolase YtcJ
VCLTCSWAAAATSRRSFIAGSLAATSAAVLLTRGEPAFAAAADSASETVFLNGAVYTMNPQAPWAQAVVVRGNRIAFVGDNAGAKAFKSAGARIVDLKGRFLMPGFVEGHIHPMIGGYLTRGVDLQLATRDELLAALAAYAKSTKDTTSIRGFGWRYNLFPDTGPRKEELDRIWPDKPVFLVAIDGHCAWVNSKALAIANVTGETPDPVPGFSYFQRDAATGEATGYLVEVPVMMQVLSASEPPSYEAVAAGTAEWFPKAAAAGITALFDAGIQILSVSDGFDLYTEFERSGKLPCRVVASYYYNDPKVNPVPLVKELRAKYRGELFNVEVLKINVDGGDLQRTAAMLAPYSDMPQTSGETLIPADVLKRVVVDADREGIDIHCHSYGDAATRLTLDAIEAAIASNPPRDRRNALAHQPIVSDADLLRFAKLGVIGQYSIQWAVADPTWEVTKARWGDRAQRMYRIASLKRSGGRISLGTDWPAAAYYSTYKPLDAIEIALTRQQLGNAGAAILPPLDERIGLAQALEANTLGSAYMLRREKDIGSIESGKLADMVVLQENLFKVAPNEIARVPVAMTMMNGRFTHET